MSERALATIRRVKEVSPIEGADRVEVAKVDGWQVVVKKGQFRSGDDAVFLEVDSFLNCEPRYEFLRPSSYRKLEDGSEGFRLRTIKLRKTLSQGLLLPISEFPELKGPHPPGEDITALLGVKKWDPPLPAQLQGVVKGRVPQFICKTDQERIQNLPEYFEKYKDVQFEITEKLDGTSATYYWNKGEFGVCSHNMELQEDSTGLGGSGGNVYWRMAKEFNIKSRLDTLKKNIAIQGEIVGPGLQKNPYLLPQVKFFVFDIWSIDEQRYLTQRERTVIMGELGEIPHVPLLGIDTIFQSYTTMDELLKPGNNFSLLSTVPVVREGFVCKSTELVDGNIISFKVINNNYLLGEDDREKKSNEKVEAQPV